MQAWRGAGEAAHSETDRLLGAAAPTARSYHDDSAGHRQDLASVRQHSFERAHEEDYGAAVAAASVSATMRRLCCPDSDFGVQEVPRLSWAHMPGELRSGLGLSQVRAAAAERFDADSEEHVALLSELWGLGPGSETPMPKQWASESWKDDFGFQGQDPVTDLRGCGVLGLRAVIHLFRRRPLLAESLRTSECLTAASAICLTAALLVHLRLLEPPGRLQDPSKSPHRKRKFNRAAVMTSRAVQADAMCAFARIAAQDFGGDVVACVCAVNTAGMGVVLAAWAQLRHEQPTASLLQFGEVLFSARVRVIHLLACGPPSFQALELWSSQLTETIVRANENIP